MEKEFDFAYNLMPPLTLSAEEHYLSIIDALTQELSKFERVKVFGDTVLIDYRDRQKYEAEYHAFLTAEQQANQKHRTIESLINEYGYEHLGFSEETYLHIMEERKQNEE